MKRGGALLSQSLALLVLFACISCGPFMAAGAADAGTVWTEDFAAGAAGWEAIQGRWEPKSYDGASALYNEYTGVVLAPLGPVEDFTFSASALSVAGEGGGLHLVFRFTDLNNYYMFRITPAAQVAEFWARVNGLFELIEAQPIEVERNKWYRLQVTAAGSQFKAYVDGELIFSIDDSRLASGRLGFRSHGSESYFADVVVELPAADGELVVMSGPGPSPVRERVVRPVNEGVWLPQAHERSMWVWKTEEIVLDPRVQDRFFQFLKAPHGRSEAAITTLFFLPEWILSDTSPLRDSVLIPKLQEFIARATAEGIVVNYMNGVHDWRFRENHPSALAAVRRVLDYNEISPPESRFNGIHLDIEKVKDVRDEYMELVRAIAAEIDSRDAGIALAFDLPPWLHDARYEYLDEQVLDVADYIGLMDYWDTADEIIRDALGPITYAGKLGKKVVVGVDVTPKSDPRQLFTTFYDEGWGYMEQELARVHEALSGYEGYGGIAIHSYDHYYYMPFE